MRVVATRSAPRAAYLQHPSRALCITQLTSIGDSHMTPWAPRTLTNPVQTSVPWSVVDQLRSAAIEDKIAFVQVASRALTVFAALPGGVRQPLYFLRDHATTEEWDRLTADLRRVTAAAFVPVAARVGGASATTLTSE